MKFWKAIGGISVGALLGVFGTWRGGYAQAPQTIQPNESPHTGNSIAIRKEGTEIAVTFTGILESAEVAQGPWNTVSNAISPYRHTPHAVQRYYRARQSSNESIFGSSEVVSMAFSGPFQAHFEKAFAGTPDGIFPPRREKPYFAGAVKVSGHELPISLRVRGNSSLQECPFPKMKFKVSKENRPGTPFADAREVRIGTHCAEGGRGPIGRLREQIAAYREALAYETMQLLGFTGPRVRRAVIDYFDTSPTNDSGTTGWHVTRKALILDDIEVVAERLGGRALDDDERSQLTNAAFNVQLVTDLYLLHVLLGNWDYTLSPDGREVWNTDVIELANGTLVPVAGDFDLASWVTGELRLMVPHDYRPDLADLVRQARYDVEQIQSRAAPEVFNASRDRFISKRPLIESQIESSDLDDAGRTNAVGHVTAFFEALSAVARDSTDRK